MKTTDQIEQLRVALAILEAQARGENVQWERHSIAKGWVNGDSSPWLCIQAQNNIRLKPLPVVDKWAAEKAALAAGKKIECRRVYPPPTRARHFEWTPASDPPVWNEQFEYRIAPEEPSAPLPKVAEDKEYLNQKLADSRIYASSLEQERANLTFELAAMTNDRDKAIIDLGMTQEQVESLLRQLDVAKESEGKALDFCIGLAGQPDPVNFVKNLIYERDAAKTLDIFRVRDIDILKEERDAALKTAEAALATNDMELTAERDSLAKQVAGMREAANEIDLVLNEQIKLSPELLDAWYQLKEALSAPPPPVVSEESELLNELLFLCPGCQGPHFSAAKSGLLMCANVSQYTDFKPKNGGCGWNGIPKSVVTMADYNKCLADHDRLQQETYKQSQEIERLKADHDKVVTELAETKAMLESKAAGVMFLRCKDHYNIPQINETEFGGGECGACIAAKLAAAEADAERLADMIRQLCPYGAVGVVAKALASHEARIAGREARA